MTSYQHLYNIIMSRPLTDDTYSERAYSVLHAAYPQANLAQINEAATSNLKRYNYEKEIHIPLPYDR